MQLLPLTPNCTIVSSRILNAPVALVYQAFENPEQLKKWWGPHGFTNTFTNFDLQVGGKWNLIMHGPDGANYNNESVFLIVDKSHRVAWYRLTNPLFHMLITFEEMQAHKTKFTFHMIFESAKECEAIRNYVSDKNEENFDRLEMVLNTMNS
jgi:uncharacterized protein YndB with AHSA1/START domain